MQLDVFGQTELLYQAQKMTCPSREPVQLPYDHMGHLAAVAPCQEILQGRALQVFARAAFVDQDVDSYQQGRFEMVEGGKKIDPVEVFDDWLNGIQFHSDIEKRNRYQSRKQHAGPVIDWVVQGIAFRMAGRILDLDDLVADFLDEPRLARI